MASILEHIRAHLDPDGTGLTEGGERLPDEEPDSAGIRWAPGAMDGVFGHHVDHGDPEGQDRRVVELLQSASTTRWRRVAARQKLYGALRELSVVSIVDDVLDHAGDPWNHHSVAQWLASEAAHREPVKFGMAMLGRAATEDDLEMLRTLGRHEEFTLFAAVALANQSAEPEVELWHLARSVDGWGRIQIIERLAGTERQDVKDWLIRGGFRNSVMNEYTAFIAATAGDLVTALEGPVDDELRDAAVDLMRALIMGGPAQDIGDYAEGPRALRLLLGEVARAPSEAGQGMFVVEAEAALADADRLDHWTPEVRSELVAECRRILADPVWVDIIEVGLASENTFWDADQLAQVMAIDTFPAVLERVRADPFSPSWWQAMQRVDATRLPQLLEIADGNFRPEVFGTGPAEEYGLGLQFAPHMALEQLVTGLARFPGVGWPHVRTALASPVIRSRNMAINTLDAWGPTAWPDEAWPALAEALSREPRDDVRTRLERLLAGQPLRD